MIGREFRSRLDAAIVGNGVTIPQLARRSGYSESYLRRLLVGKQNNPTIFAVATLAESLDCCPFWLLGTDE